MNTSAATATAFAKTALGANADKQLYIDINGKTYARYAIKTHFVHVGEDYVDLVRTYVLPHWQPGDLLSSSEKVVALCQGRIVKKEDMHISLLARVLSPFASPSAAGIGVDCPYKMQFAIDEVGAPRVLFAAHRRRRGQAVGRRGVFYEIVGRRLPAWTASTTTISRSTATMASAFRSAPTRSAPRSRRPTECAP